jgi:hypothetical protein
MKKCTRSAFLFLAVVLSFLFSNAYSAGNDEISMQGVWGFQTDPSDLGVTEKWYQHPLKETIQLAGSMVENGKGDVPTLKTKWTGSIYDSSWFYNPRMAKYRQPGNIKFPFWLTPDKYYVGAAWYQKVVTIPADWKGKRVVLYLERPHWQTQVWVDDKLIGDQNSLLTPHQYEFTNALAAGKHTITIRIDNRLKPVNVGPDSHSVTDHTQGNWNGIVGQLKLLATSPVFIADVRVFPNIKTGIARAIIVIHGAKGKGQVELSAETVNAPLVQKVNAQVFTYNGSGDTLVVEYSMGSNVQLWDEFNPVFYNLTTVFTDASGKKDTQKTIFGMREFKANGTRFEVNGNITFMRGTVENCDFPLTGYAPMDEASWTRVFQICKNNGLNHMRFHSFCPPEAAFVAADKAGMYLHIECGSWANHGVSLGRNEPVDQYILDEAERIVKEYGNHPSFCMMAYGNEPRGNYVPYLTKFVSYWKAKDSRRMYTGAAIGGGWNMTPGSEYQIRATPRGLPWSRTPESTFDFAGKLENQTVPYISHEVGQYCVFPDFKEIKKYTGSLKAKNFELFQEDLADNHMADQAQDFLMASGKLQAICYKAEIEAALRTPGFGGFELLSLNDYSGQGTALVGLLNVFWDEKGYITSKEFSRFCNTTVPLARIPKFVYKNNEVFKASVEVAHFSKPIENAKSSWKITDEKGNVISSGAFDAKTIAIGNGQSLGSISTPLSGIEKAARLNLEVTVDKFSNDWDFWVYPASLPKLDSAGIYFTDVLDAKAEETLNNGGKVFLEAAGKVENGKDVVQTLTPVFWNTSWFKMRPPHTTGILVQNNHLALADFPTEYHSNVQWFELATRQQVMNLENFPVDFRPIIQPIDTWFINRRLAMLFEAKVGNGKLVVCSADVKTDPDKRTVAAQLRYSITKYMLSDKFVPKYSVDLATIKELFEVKARKGFNTYTKDAPDELKQVPKVNK